MLFQFLKYINPSWYFNLSPKGNNPYFPDYDFLNEDEKQIIQLDENYSTPEVTKLDAAYQAWNRGIIVRNHEIKLSMNGNIPNVSDNYHFIRKFFHPLWSVYVLIIRLLSLNNPFIEISAFWCQRNLKRVNLFEKVINHHKAILKFKSRLLEENPKVAIIIPTLNRYRWLFDALKDLESQDYKNFEVIVVDQSFPVIGEFYDQFNLNIKLIQQSDKALWLARNTAIEETNAEYILLYDDDSRTKPNWISQHIKCLDYFNCHISSGVSISVVGAKVPKNYSFFRWGDQVDTGNVMVKREVFRKIGLFDRQFEKQRQGDGEFGLRAYLGGFKNISNPFADRLHLKVGTGGLREIGSWDGFRPKSWLGPRPIPSVLYMTRKYFGAKAALFLLLISVPPSIIPYRFKSSNFKFVLGIAAFIVFLPLFLMQIIRSWLKSTRMLKDGPKIKYI